MTVFGDTRDFDDVQYPPHQSSQPKAIKDQTKILSVYLVAAQSGRDLHQRRYAIAIVAGPNNLKGWSQSSILRYITGSVKYKCILISKYIQEEYLGVQSF